MVFKEISWEGIVMFRIYIDVKSEDDAVILQKILHESLWKQRAMRYGKEDLTVHMIEVKE